MDHTFQPPLQLVAARGLGSDQWFVSRSELLHYRASPMKTSQEALSKLYPLLPGWNRGNTRDDLGSHRFILNTLLLQQHNTLGVCISVPQMRKLRFREHKELAQGQPSVVWQNQNSKIPVSTSAQAPIMDLWTFRLSL